MRLKRVSWSKKLVNIPGVAFSDYESETAFQIYCADWLRKQYELTGKEKFKKWHHSANERPDARSGFTAKMMGQSKGMLDFVHFGMEIALELKVQERLPTPEQIEWIYYFRSIGWRAEVVRSFEAFKELVLGQPLRRNSLAIEPRKIGSK